MATRVKCAQLSMADSMADDDGGCRACTFFMLSADFVRQFPGKSLPFFQEIRDHFVTDEPLVEVSLDYAEVVKGTHIETTLSVSHRWMQPDDPDPDGEQLKALKGFLNSPDGKKIERVWIDSACMPQDHPKGSRSAKDAAVFKRMLAEVNRLYLGTTVLILLDLSYVSRFWTQFESWMSMQFATPEGLKPAVGTKNERHRIVCTQNAGQAFKTALVDMWATKTPGEAHAILSKPDVTVTNQKDKEGQLPKIKALDATVQGAFGGVCFDRERVQLSEGGTLATKVKSKGFRGNFDLVTMEQQPMTKGTHYFELAVDRQFIYVYVGLVKPGLGRNGSKHATFAGYADFESTVGWFMDLDTGGLCGHGKLNESKAGRIDGERGDRLGVLANLDDGSLRFFKNGSPHGPGWPAGSVQGPVVLGVQMGSKGDSVRLFPRGQMKYRR